MSSPSVVIQLITASDGGERQPARDAAQRLRAALGARWVAVHIREGSEEESWVSEAAQGADALVEISSHLPLDYLGRARLLASWIQSQTDIVAILASDFAGTGEGEAVGPAVAEYLELPHYAGVCRVEVADGAFRVHRRGRNATDERRLEQAAVFCLLPDAEGLPAAAAGSPPMQRRTLDSTSLDEEGLGLLDRMPVAEHARPRPTATSAELYSSPQELANELRRRRLWTR